jgi:hypothetical protein
LGTPQEIVRLGQLLADRYGEGGGDGGGRRAGRHGDRSSALVLDVDEESSSIPYKANLY